MATIVKGLERIEVLDTDLRIQAYRALQKAAERIGYGNYLNGVYHAHKRRGKRGLVVGGYIITQAHEDIIKAMPKVLSGELDPEAAMNLLRRGDVLEERLNG